MGEGNAQAVERPIAGAWPRGPRFGDSSRCRGHGWRHGAGAEERSLGIVPRSVSASVGACVAMQGHDVPRDCGKGVGERLRPRARSHRPVHLIGTYRTQNAHTIKPGSARAIPAGQSATISAIRRK